MTALEDESYVSKGRENQGKNIGHSTYTFFKRRIQWSIFEEYCEDAGLTTGAFCKYYPTKEMLFDALTDPYVEHIYEIYDGILSEFEELSADEQTRNMSGTSSEGMDQMIDYIYDHYDNFRLLLKCGDSGKFEDFIHNMVEREVEASQKYMKAMCDAGIEFPAVSKSLMHMIYTGFFSSVLQIIEHDMDRETAKKNVYQLMEFQTGCWERLWNIKFPAEDK